MSDPQPIPPIVNRMEDLGDGRHIGWWEENHVWPTSMLIEVNADWVKFACCEGERGRRHSFIVRRERAVEIARALSRALGMGG